MSSSSTSLSLISTPSSRHARSCDQDLAASTQRRSQMSHPMPRQREYQLERASGHRVSTRLERATRQEVDLVQAHGLVQAARTQAVEYVTVSALRAVEGLTELEALALQRNPLGEARYKVIVDTATGALARLVAETGQG